MFLALRIERRAIAAAVFRDSHLEFVDGRALASAASKAEGSCVSFIEWILSNFDIQSAAVELPDGAEDTTRAGIHVVIEACLRQSRCPLHKVDRDELRAAFGHPPLTSRAGVRAVAANIWPILDAQKLHPARLDAVALGLYVQTERLFQ